MLKILPRLIFVFVGIGLGGCSSWTFGGKPQIPSDLLSICKDKTCPAADVTRAVSLAMQYCLDVHNYYERQGRNSTATSLTIGGVGTLAGSVFAIGAMGNAAKAWSGLSGAANAAQTQINGSPLGYKDSENKMKNIENHIVALSQAASAQDATPQSLITLSFTTAAQCGAGAEISTNNNSQGASSQIQIDAILAAYQRIQSEIPKGAKGDTAQVLEDLRSGSMAILAAKDAISTANTKAQSVDVVAQGKELASTTAKDASTAAQKAQDSLQQATNQAVNAKGLVGQSTSISDADKKRFNDLIDQLSSAIVATQPGMQGGAIRGLQGFEEGL